MSVYSGPKISTDGLVLCLDANNPESIKGQRSIITWNFWTVGTSAVAGYNLNGDSNSRLIDTNPWGNSDIVWDSSNNDTSSDADGGWNTSNFPIDNTKVYRFTTWVRRKAIGNGYFYLGLNGFNSADSNTGVLRRSTAVIDTNPYFSATGWWGLANTWYLVVGHVWPVGSGIGDIHPDSGIYTVEGVRVGSVNDFVWHQSNTRSRHRSYLYYSTDPATNQQWYQPRVDLCDGTEPSISDLLNNIGNTWQDVSGNSRHFMWSYSPKLSYDQTLSYFTTLGNRCTGPQSNSFNITNESGYTIFLVLKQLALEGSSAFKFYSGNLPGSAGRGIFSHCTWGEGTIYFDQGGCCNSDTRTAVLSDGLYTWSIVVFRRLTASSVRSIIKNGVTIATNNNQAANLNLDDRKVDLGSSDELGGNSSTWNAQLNSFIVYNRGLSDEEIQKNFHALRGRFGL